MQLEKQQLSLGFIPLTDCAPLVIAKERGFFAEQGLDVTLSREPSWANIRDKVVLGVLDGAQMLAPMPLAASLGLGGVHKPMITAFSLALNGNAITVSNNLYQQLQALSGDQFEQQRPITADTLRTLIAQRESQGLPQLMFATVFPYSMHNYQLRYWLASAGINPERDLRLLVVPPPQMVSHLNAGYIDGFCVGAPWNALAVKEGLGRILITGYEIWNNSPEKVLGVTEEWANDYPNTHQALLRALLRAAHWLDDPDNRLEAAYILSHPEYLDIPSHLLSASLSGKFRYTPEGEKQHLPDYHVFYRYAATLPWHSHADWILAQMLRWGQIPDDLEEELPNIARSVYRPDLYRQAVAALNENCPKIDSKNEGEHQQPWTLEGTHGPLTMGTDSFFDRG